jgi:glutathione S-transferase
MSRTDMLQIWGRLSSINVRKVVWAAQEAGASFNRRDAGAHFGIVRTPDYLRLNPNAMVPTLQDGDLVLWESNVIVRYLASRHPGSGLLPDNTAQRFIAEQWMDWQQTSFNPAGRDAFIQLIRTPAGERQATLVEQSVARTAPLLDLLERHLAQSPYMAGDAFSMADIPLGCEMHRWYGLPLAHAPRAHLDDWYARLRARPASRGVLDLPLS